MKSLFTIFVLGLAVAAARADQPPAHTVDMGVLLDEMRDLAALASRPSPAYRNIQFSSYDRRSTTPEAPGWFSNADGFGGEPIPGFLKTLRQPAGGKPGLYLLADVRGPGAIVRGWSAGMEGILRVYLDPKSDDPAATDGTLIYQGPAYGFLARRSAHFLKAVGIKIDAKNAFTQQDADYLPIPFARGLRVTWEGSLDELHFYHLQVRKYAAGTDVRSFDAKEDLKRFEPEAPRRRGGPDAAAQPRRDHGEAAGSEDRARPRLGVVAREAWPRGLARVEPQARRRPSRRGPARLPAANCLRRLAAPAGRVAAGRLLRLRAGNQSVFESAVYGGGRRHAHLPLRHALPPVDAAGNRQSHRRDGRPPRPHSHLPLEMGQRLDVLPRQVADRPGPVRRRAAPSTCLTSWPSARGLSWAAPP